MFPQTPLPLRVKIAPGAQPAANPITWPQWVDISPDVRVEQGVGLSDGRPNEAAVVDPGEASWTVDNRTGKYVLGNPLSTYYGLLRRNCPVRIGVEIAQDNFNRTVSNGWGTPSAPNFPGMSWTVSGAAADWSVTGTQAQLNILANTARIATLTGAEAYNVEGKATMSVSAVATGDALIWAAIGRYIDNGNYYMLQLRFGLLGTLQLGIMRWQNGGGFNVTSFPTIPGTYTAGTRICLRWQINGSNILMKAWPEAGAEPTLWQLSYSDTSIVKGGTNGFVPWRQGSNTNVGTILMSLDDYLLESIEWSGNITEFPVEWDQSGNDSTAPLKANGVLTRISGRSTPFKSPLYRQLIAQSPTGYWPLEDDSGSIAPSTPLPAATGVRPAFAQNVNFGASATGLAGAQQVAQFADPSAQMSMYPNSNSVGTGFSAMFFFKLATIPGSGPRMASIFVENGPVRRWDILTDGSSLTLIGYDSTNAAIVTPGSVLLVENPLQWIAIQLETEVVGANTTYALLWQGVGKSTTWAISGSFANTIVSRATAMRIEANTVFNGMSLAHAWLGPNTLPFNTSTFFSVSNGYIGELASARFLRLCAEEGVIAYAEPGNSEPMGAQSTNALMPLLRECEATDMGVIYEDGFGLGYRPRSQRYGKAVDITIDRTAGHLASPPRPTNDGQSLVNFVTGSRPGGAQNITASDTAHVAAEGRFDGGAPGVNPASDSALQSNLQWRVFLGTRPDMRWPSISLNFARNPQALLASWRGRPRWGARMIMVNEMSQVLSLAPDVIVEGTTQHLSDVVWDVTVNASPAKPYDVAVADSTALGRADTAGSQLTTAVNTSATSFIVATTAGPVWRTGAYPSTLLSIEGEIVALTNVASATSPQTFTVTRSANGIAKAHPIGAAISLAYPARAAY